MTGKQLNTQLIFDQGEIWTMHKFYKNSHNGIFAVICCINKIEFTVTYLYTL